MLGGVKPEQLRMLIAPSAFARIVRENPDADWPGIVAATQSRRVRGEAIANPAGLLLAMARGGFTPPAAKGPAPLDAAERERRRAIGEAILRDAEARRDAELEERRRQRKLQEAVV